MRNLLKKFLNWWAKYARVEIISGHGDPDSAYLVRYHLINNRFFKLYFHKFLRSDLDDFHDHPWGFATLMISGAYTEELYDWRTRSHKRVRRDPGQNSLVFRDANAIHRIILDKEYAVAEQDQATTTLFFATRKSKEWGFIRDYATAPKWTHWKEYLGVE